MNVADLTDTLIKALTQKHGRSQRNWRAALGPITVHDTRTHPHCNWSVSPTGSAVEIAAIEDLLDEIRLQHPITRPD